MLRKITCFAVLLMLVTAWPVSALETGAAFSRWIDEFRAQAAAQGISPQILDMALHDVEFLPWVIEADRRQPEFKKSLAEYLAARVTESRIKQGRRLLEEHRSLLNRIAAKYRVQPHYLVALWAIESNFGRNTGKVPILSALATLAYDARRSDYFRQELLNALRILGSGTLNKQQLIGSWAGAMGQLQFMPSTFLGYAVDGDGDGQIDLWQSRADYLSSAANYLQKSGWQWRQKWGRAVRAPEGFSVSLLGLQYRDSLHHWQKKGVRQKNGWDLPVAAMTASLLLPEGTDGDAFLVYDNYRVLMTWNRAHSFALAVGMLADQLAEKGRD